MSKNVLTVTFKNEADAYKALSSLKKYSVNYNILTAGLVKKENNRIIAEDGFDFDSDKDSNWAVGGLLGSFIGILGGPLGMLLGGSLGALFGDIIDIDNTSDSNDTFTEVISELDNDGLVLLVLADEDDTQALDDQLITLGAATIKRESVASIQNKIIIAEETQKELEKEAHEKLKAEKKKDHQEKVAAKKAEIKEKFEKFKNKK